MKTGLCAYRMPLHQFTFKCIETFISLQYKLWQRTAWGK